MARQAIAFSTNEARSHPLDAARLVNLFPEQPPLGSRAPALQVGISSPIKSVLYGTPGLSLWQTLGSGRARAAHYALGYLWTLYGATLYRIAEDGTSVACVGDAIPAAGNAMIVDNGVQVAVLAGTELYVVGSVAAIGSFTVTGGTNAAGTNQIAGVTVNAVTVTGGAIDWADSNEAVAAAIAASINAHTSSPEYTASTNGATVIIKAADTGPGPNGYGIVVTVAGDVTVTPPSGSSLSGGALTSTTVQQVTADAFPEAGLSSIDYVDGYVVYTVAVSETSNRQWGITKLYDATNMDALDFASAESTPSDLLRVLVNYEEVWLFSRSGISVWRNTGASPFPFERIPGAVMERGCAAALSPAKINGAVFWLGDDKKVYKASAYQPARISTHGMEDQLRAVDVTDAVGMTYSQNGHDYYILTVPALARTFAWDEATSSWHERQSGTTLTPKPWLVRWITPAFGRIYAGLDAGRLCELDLDTYEDTTGAIRRVAVTPPLYSDGKRAIVSFLEFECELGVGLSTGQGSAPEVMMRWSDDGGTTWSNERRAPLGPMGKRQTRAVFRRLGIFRQRMFEFSISDPVKIAAYGMNYQGRGATA